MSQPPPKTPPTPSSEPSAQATRGDELLTGVGHTVYEFQGNPPGAVKSADLGVSMGRPQRSNLSSGRGGVAIWIGAAVLLGAGVLFWKINSGSASADAPDDQPKVEATSGPGQSAAQPALPAGAASAAADATGPDTKAKADADAAKKKAEQEAAAKQKAEQEAAAKKKAEQEAAAKKKAEQEAAAKKKAEQEAAAKKKAATKPKPKPKAKKKPKKKSGVKRIKPRPRKPSGLDGLPDPD